MPLGTERDGPECIQIFIMSIQTTNGEMQMKQFSIVIPFRDTPCERKFAETSIPAAIKLNPSEIVIGVDAPAVREMYLQCN